MHMKLPRKRNEEQQCEYIWFPLDILFTPFGMVLDFFFGNITSISIVWLELNSMFLLFFKLGRKVFGFFPTVGQMTDICVGEFM